MCYDADVVGFADDCFFYNYEEIVLKSSSDNPNADAIASYVNSLNPDKPFYHITEHKRIRGTEARNLTPPMLVVKKEKLLYYNIHFSLLFGGGTKYGAGEDIVLIQNMLDVGLHIYTVPIKIADIERNTTTWSTGYNKKFFF